MDACTGIAPVRFHSRGWVKASRCQQWLTELISAGRAATLLQSQAVTTDGNWHRIGSVWDGLCRTLYVDGVAVAEDAQDGLKNAGNGLYIGTGKAMAPGTYFSGLIDDVRIYNRAVSP